VGTSTLLLATVLVAFARTFFFRSFFDVPTLPGYLYVHGFVLTSWFVLVAAQTWLVAARRTDLHRRLGVVGLVVAFVVVTVSTVVVIQYVPRAVMRSVDPAGIRSVVLGDFVALIVFALLVMAGVYWRRRPDAHKRLMLMASITIVGPAIVRLQPLGFPLSSPEFRHGLLAALLIYDLLTIRRPHMATACGGLFVVIAWLIGRGLTSSDVGRAIVDALR
jgi:hypothetical protein